MTTDQISAVILKDQAGEYFVLPQATLDEGRVPAEAKAAIEAHTPELQAIRMDDDAQGHAAFVAAAAVGFTGVMVGFAVGEWLGGSDLGPLISAYAAQYGG